MKKTQEEIRQMAEKIFCKHGPNNHSFDMDKYNDGIEDRRIGYFYGYTACQDDNKPVDVGTLKEKFYKANPDLITSDDIFNWFLPHLKPAESDAVEFIKWYSVSMKDYDTRRRLDAMSFEEAYTEFKNQQP